MDRSGLIDRMQGGVFISSMMGVTDGAFVARHGAGAAMVQIGALVADLEDRTHEARYLLPERQADMVPLLRDEVDAARAALGDLPIGLNAAPGDMESALRMAAAFGEAGGDIFELNVHGGYGKLLDRGLLRAMVLPQNRPAMTEWLRALCELDIPIVVKFWGATEGVDFAQVLGELQDIDGLFGVHFNVRLHDGDTPDLDLTRRVAAHTPGMLFCSGHVTTRDDVDALLEAGAGCVGVAQGLLDGADAITRLLT